MEKSGENMFSGYFEPKMDDKGRIIVPMKLREKLGQTFHITKGVDGCLFLFSEEGWQEFYTALAEANSKNPKSRQVLRYFSAPVFDGEVDKQGRMLVPQNLRSFAELDKEIVMLGMGKRIEVWDAATYKQTEISAEEASELLMDMDIVL